MSKPKLALVVLLGLLLVGASMYWSGRSHGADDIAATEFSEDEHAWTSSLSGVAGWVGRVFGQGPNEFDMDRLLPGDGLSRTGSCRPPGCEYRFAGAAVMRIRRRANAKRGFSDLYLRTADAAEIKYEAAGIEYDESPSPEGIGGDELISLPVGHEGGRIEFNCQLSDGSCLVRFSSTED